MDLHSGFPFWLIKNGLPFTYPKLLKNIKTHVVILGGGITGAIQAYFLAKSGIDFVVVEKRSIGLGSTCASTSLLQYQIDTSLSELTELVGKDHAVRSYQLCADSIFTLEKISNDIGYENFERKPTLFYASYKKDIPFILKEHELHKKHGFEVELWDEKKIKKNFGFSSPAAMYSHHSATIDAYKFCHEAMQFVIKKGYQVFDRTEITKITHAKNGVNLKTEDGFTLEADWLIYANGYEVVNYLDKKVVDLNTTWAVISEQIQQKGKFWKDNALIWETKEPYLYMRSTNDNRIIVGGRDEEMNNAGKRDDMLKKKAEQLQQDFVKLFPEIPFKTEFEWAGTFGSTKDGLPYIGEFKPKPRGLFALGFGGNGITFSAIAAQIITDKILGKENPDEEIFSFER